MMDTIWSLVTVAKGVIYILLYALVIKDLSHMNKAKNAYIQEVRYRRVVASTLVLIALLLMDVVVL